MKTLITLFVACSVALAVSVRADNNPNNKKKNNNNQAATSPAKSQAASANAVGAKKGHQGQGQHHGQGQGQNQGQNQNLSQNNNNPNAHGKHHNAKNSGGGNGNNGQNGQNANNAANANNANNANNVNNAKFNKHISKQQLHNTPQWQANHQKAQAIHQQHLNFKAQQNQAIASAQFNKNYKIQNAQNWKGNKYVVFKNYQPQWHDQFWWHNHYHNNIFLFAGGWYFWNAGYYYPAWGYDTGQAYYPYDGPIYVGQTRQPLDQTIADVQSALQEQGYYKGEVDGLMGPLTRAALAEYQQSQGLEATAAMDEPTLESLGMA
jgi:hypothetical protein